MQTLRTAPESAFKESSHEGEPPPELSPLLSSRAPGSPARSPQAPSAGLYDELIPEWVPEASRSTTYLAAGAGGFILLLLLCVWCCCCRARRNRRNKFSRRERTAVSTTLFVTSVCPQEVVQGSLCLPYSVHARYPKQTQRHEQLCISE